jgi:RNA polymerase sigma-70 factor (ECF subfamily)
MHDADTTQLQQWLGLLQQGDESARASLIEHSCDRLVRLTRTMFHDYPRLHRWEETDDVLQNAMLRLHRSLSVVKPKSVPEFLGLAATQIRRSLIDLTRHHFRVKGDAVRHETDGSRRQRGSLVEGQSDRALEPQSLEEWSEFHQQIEALPDPEREVFQLLWYEGLDQAEIAHLLGVDVRTVKRRWRSAKLLIHEALGGPPPHE